MIYLLDADALITSDRTYYPPSSFPPFWDWLDFQAEANVIKTPFEIYSEITRGNGPLVDWLKDRKERFILDEQVDPKILADVISKGYAPDLNQDEFEKIGRDPFLVAYGFANTVDRTVVTFERSAPAKIRGNRKLPDVCDTFGVKHCTIFDLIKALNFSTSWKRP